MSAKHLERRFVPEESPGSGTAGGDQAIATRTRWYAAWDAVPAMVAVVRARDLVYEYANRAYCETANFDEPPVGRPFGEDSAGRTDLDLRALLRRVSDTGEPFMKREAFVNSGTQGERWFDLSYQPVRDAAGGVESILLFAVDVTERRLAQREAEDRAVHSLRQRDALRTSETRLRRVMDSTMMGIVFWDAEGTIPECNDAFLRITGYEREHVVERRLRCRDITPPEWAEVEARAHLELRERGMCAPFEKEYLRRDGTRVPILIGGATFPDAPNEGVAFVVDLTEKKRHEQQLEEAQMLLRTVIQNLPLAIFAVDAAGRLQLAKGRLLEQNGLTEDGVVGRRVEEIYPDASPPRLNLERALAGESFFVRDDYGPTGVYESNYAPLRGEGGQVQGAIGMSVDVTERVRAEERQAELEEQMLRAQKLESLGLLAGGVAHDFNNLLTGIMGNVSVARLDADPEARAALDDALSAARHAASLTRQLLAYAGRTPFDVRRVDPSQRIGEIARLLEASLPKKVQLRLDLASGLPAIEADVSQLQQVVMNLVINAAEATVGTSGVVCVRTRAGAGGRVVLEVEDNGCGMDAATRARIFDPFFTTKGTGRGLGLAAIQGIVRGHRGTIEIASAPARGTIFTLSFPPAPPPSAASPSAAAPPLRGRGAVLVVDDEAQVRRAARRALERLGFEVLEVDGGRAAIQTFEARGADIVAILLDVTMPDLSGEETLAELRARGIRAPVLLSSGYGELDPEMRSDVTGFLPKPYTSAELEAALSEALRPS